ncbi:putative phage associated protein [Neisseria meningitidis]|nr:putative phage associated protein [Neisseria meningitidis]
MQTLLDDLLDEKETAFPQDREKQHIKDIELEEKIISNFLNSKGNSNV